MFKPATVIFSSIISFTVIAQEGPAKISYDYSMAYSPTATSLYRNSAAVEYASGSLTYSVSGAAYHLDYQNSKPIYYMGLEDVYTLKPSVSYLAALGKNWKGRVAFAPELTTVPSRPVSWNNMVPGFYIGSEKEYGNAAKTTLEIGIQYSSLIGRPFLLPVIAWRTNLCKVLRLTAGFPETSLAFSPSGRHSIKVLLYPDSFYANLNGYTYNEQDIRSLQLLRVNGGAEYLYKSTASWIGFIKAGYGMYSSLTLKGKEQDTDIQFLNNFSVNLGFKYNFKF